MIQPKSVWTPVLRGLLRALSVAGPVPAIPVREQPVSTWQLGEPVIAGPEGERLFQDVVSHVNNLALENDVEWLLLPLVKNDPLHRSLRRAFFARRLCPVLRPFLTVQAALLVKSLTEACPRRLERIYLDAMDF